MKFILAQRACEGSLQPFKYCMPHFLPLASVGAGLKCCVTPGINFSQAGPELHYSLNRTSEKA